MFEFFSRSYAKHVANNRVFFIFINFNRWTRLDEASSGCLGRSPILNLQKVQRDNRRHVAFPCLNDRG